MNAGMCNDTYANNKVVTLTVILLCMCVFKWLEVCPNNMLNLSIYVGVGQHTKWNVVSNCE